MLECPGCDHPHLFQHDARCQLERCSRCQLPAGIDSNGLCGPCAERDYNSPDKVRARREMFKGFGW